MIESNWIEIFGFVASIFIAISLTMKSIIKLRIINLIGAFLLGTYGILIASTPVTFLNYFIGFVNIYYLWKLSKERKGSCEERKEER